MLCSLLLSRSKQYSSTYECLDYMYAKVVPGGLIYIDDYWEFEVQKQH